MSPNHVFSRAILPNYLSLERLFSDVNATLLVTDLEIGPIQVIRVAVVHNVEVFPFVSASTRPFSFPQILSEVFQDWKTLQSRSQLF
jgi:hypothetical protein